MVSNLNGDDIRHIIVETLYQLNLITADHVSMVEYANDVKKEMDNEEIKNLPVVIAEEELPI